MLLVNLWIHHHHHHHHHLQPQIALSTVVRVEGCLEEVVASLSRLEVGMITNGPFCCKATAEISDGCWQKLLPSNVDPLLPVLLKDYCVNHIVAPPVLPPTLTRPFYHGRRPLN
ncbi:Prolamin-like domain [Macleaya cordata]|uniref:Prolamin-like domain n=1 Tax=Macleaya cordata TaxID=56857 RepID=A0A200R0K7_MACCD|nr:Prolamin-like domain [Macleaya cordata]